MPSETDPLRTEIRIAAPPETVFPYFTDPASTTVDAPAEDVYAALATQDGPARNWTDELEVPEETGGIARFGFGPE